MRTLLDGLIRIVCGLRVRLLLLVLLTCAPLVVLMLHNAGEGRRRAIANWQRRPERIAETVRRGETNLLLRIRPLLVGISEVPRFRALNQEECMPLLQELSSNVQAFAAVGLLATNGDLVATTHSVWRNQNLAQRPFFRRVMETREFAFESFHKEGLAQRPTIHFGNPVLNESGQVLAVMFAEVDLQRFASINSSEAVAQLPKGATFTEVDAAGTVLVRQVNPLGPSPVRQARLANSAGRRLPAAVLQAVLAEPSGVLESRDEANVPTVFAFTSTPSLLTPHDVAVVLGMPARVLFAETDRVLRQNLTWLGLAAALALLMGWTGSHFMILRPVQTLVKTSARLAAGELGIRTGLKHGRSELGQLTLAFDQMAPALERREIERQHASSRLQALSHRLVEVQESERRHIARELHDEIGQSLTAAEMNLQAALQLPEAAALERRLAESIEAVERVLEQVHDLSLNLRPSMLDDLGLEPALRWYTRRQADLAGLKGEFHPVPLAERLPAVVETGCFRVAQEALTNVVRHARARSVAVELTQIGQLLHLIVRDDGVGFDVSALRARAMRGASLGLLSMEERTVLAGGGFELKSKPGRGTEVHAWFPLDGRGSAETFEMHEHTR